MLCILGLSRLLPLTSAVTVVRYIWSLIPYMVVYWFLQWTGEHRGMITDCNFSHDGKLVVSTSDIDHTAKLWDTLNGKMVKEIPGRFFLAFSYNEYVQKFQ